MRNYHRKIETWRWVRVDNMVKTPRHLQKASKLIRFSCQVHCGFFLSGLQMKHMNDRFQDEKNKEVVLMCIGITSGVGRLLFGRIADYVPGVKKVYLQVLA